ncbi:MAG: hypothetical protein AAGA54_08685 [Myxococcota bacterium]
MVSAALLLLAPLVDVTWDVPASCPSQEVFEAMVVARANVEAQASPATTRASVKVREVSPQRWSLALTIEHGDEREAREYEAQTCAGVVEAAAVLVSLRVVEWSGPEPLVPEPEPQPEPPPAEAEPRPDVEPALVAPELPPAQPSTPPRTQGPAEAPAPPRRAVEIGGWLGAHGGVGFGVAPGVGGSLTVEGGVQGRGWRAGLAVQTTPRQFGDHPDAPEVRGRFDVVLAQALACGVPTAGRVSFPLCGRVAGGGLRGAGRGAVTTADSAWGAWWGLGGSAAISFALTTRLAAVGTAEALASLRPWVFSVGGVSGLLHQTGPVAVRGSLGLELIF